MQYKNVVILFSIGLPVGIILRLIQLNFIVEAKTGFFSPEFSVFGYAILALFFIIALLFVISSFVTHRCPEHTPSVNIPLSISSFIAAIGVFANTFFSKSTTSFQSALLNISAICTIAFFISLGVKAYIDFNLPKFTFLFPCIYFILDIIKEFTTVSSIAVISDNILLIAALCSLMVFSLQFAKLYNDTDEEYNFRKLLASGLVSSFFCYVQSIPYFIFNIISDTPDTHILFSSNLSLLCIGSFVSVFLFSHFSRKNACIRI